MILEALRVLLFGMLGIFLVMAIIFGVIVLLSKISAWSNKRTQAIPVNLDDSEFAPAAAESSSPEAAGPVLASPVAVDPVAVAPVAVGYLEDTDSDFASTSDDDYVIEYVTGDNQVIYMTEEEYLQQRDLGYLDDAVIVEEPVYEEVEL